MNNSASVIYEYADILEQWKQELFSNAEEWEFTLDDGSKITKKVVIL